LTAAEETDVERQCRERQRGDRWGLQSFGMKAKRHETG
jgi:hypothetical protein